MAIRSLWMCIRSLQTEISYLLLETFSVLAGGFVKAAGRMDYCFIRLEGRELGCMRDGSRPSLSFSGHWQIWLEGAWQLSEGVLSG